MINKISRNLASLMGTKLQSNKDEIDIFTYGLEIIIGSTLKLILIIVTSYILGIIKPTIVYLINFILFRKFGGGVYLNTYKRCLFVGLIIILGLGKLSTINISIYLLEILSFIVVMLGIFTIKTYVPAGTEKKKITDNKNRVKQKKKTILVLIIWILVVFVLIKARLLISTFACILGALSSFFFMTPQGYFVMHTFDNILNNIFKNNKEGGIENI